MAGKPINEFFTDNLDLHGFDNNEELAQTSQKKQVNSEKKKKPYTKKKEQPQNTENTQRKKSISLFLDVDDFSDFQLLLLTRTNETASSVLGRYIKKIIKENRSIIEKAKIEKEEFNLRL